MVAEPRQFGMFRPIRGAGTPIEACVESIAEAAVSSGLVELGLLH